MDILQAILLGALQGITEWLPISSSGQLVLSLVDLLKVEPQAAFSLAIMLHVGTLFAVAVKYRKDLLGIIGKLSWKDDLTRFLVVSTAVTGVVGIPVYFLLKSIFIYGELTNALVGGLLMLTGTLLYFSRNAGFGDIGLARLGYKEMAVAGAAQGISILPGISRSGTTIAAMLLMGIRQDIALKLSFLMSIPAVIGVVVIDYGDFSSSGFGLPEVAMGIIFAFLFGYLTIDVLLKAARGLRFDLFCIALGAVALIAFFL